MSTFRKSLTPWLLVSLMALSGCAGKETVRYVPTPCPPLPPAPEPLMLPPPPPLRSASQIRSLLFESVMPLTPESSSSGSR